MGFHVNSNSTAQRAEGQREVGGAAATAQERRPISEQDFNTLAEFVQGPRAEAARNNMPSADQALQDPANALARAQEAMQETLRASGELRQNHQRLINTIRNIGL